MWGNKKAKPLINNDLTFCFVTPIGFKPITAGAEIQCAIQLRHGAFFGEWCKSFLDDCATEPFFGEKLCFIKSKDFLNPTQTNKPSSEVQMYDQLHKRPNRLLN
jgi:hypothetical protein